GFWSRADDADPLAAPAGAPLGLPAADFASIAGGLQVLPKLLAVRRRGGPGPRSADGDLAGGAAARALSPVCGGRSRSRSSPCAGWARGQEGCMNKNQNLFLAVAIWLACMLALYTFFP